VKTHQEYVSFFSSSLVEEEIVNHDVTALGKSVKRFLDQHLLDIIIPVMKNITEKYGVYIGREIILEKIKCSMRDSVS
jgi:hypothetical protein